VLEVVFEDEDEESASTAPVTVPCPPPDVYAMEPEGTDPFIDASDPMLFAFESAEPYPVSRTAPAPSSAAASSSGVPTPRAKRAG
jgi:hypothetical protein